MLCILATSLLFACAANETENGTNTALKGQITTPQKQLRHVVLFSFKDSATLSDVQAVEAAFAALPNKIPQIRDFEWGTNNSPEGLDKGFTHCFFLTFDSEEDRAAYLPHPDHKAFGEVLSPHLKDVLVIDYWVED